MFYIFVNGIQVQCILSKCTFTPCGGYFSVSTLPCLDIQLTCLLMVFQPQCRTTKVVYKATIRVYNIPHNYTHRAAKLRYLNTHYNTLCVRLFPQGIYILLHFAAICLCVSEVIITLKTLRQGRSRLLWI